MKFSKNENGLGKTKFFQKKSILVITFILLFILLVVNVNATINCSNLITDIEISIDDEPYINKKTSFFAILPSQYVTHSMKCLTYVKSFEDKIIQINPQTIKFSEVVVPIFRKQEESREFFSAEEGVVNVYITYRDLVAYTQFVLEIECISEDTGVSVIGQKCITPYYKELKNVGTRAVWSLQNADMLIILIIVIVIVIVFLGAFYRKIFKH